MNRDNNNVTLFRFVGIESPCTPECICAGTDTIVFAGIAGADTDAKALGISLFHPLLTQAD